MMGQDKFITGRPYSTGGARRGVRASKKENVRVISRRAQVQASFYVQDTELDRQVRDKYVTVVMTTSCFLHLSLVVTQVITSSK